MGMRTDLALESLPTEAIRGDFGVKSEVIRKGEIEINKVSVLNEAGERKTGKPVGNYYTVDVGSFKSPAADLKSRSEICSEIIKTLLKGKAERVLVVGLGNREITPDALGPVASKYILATRHLPKELKASLGFQNESDVSVIAPGVMGQTGIESAEIISSLVRELSPTAVIAVDALASKSVDRLSSTVQISDVGISPGSGVLNRRKEVSEKTLGVPVLAVGVPMVVDLATIAEEFGGKASEGESSMMVTSREIDLAVEHAGKVVAYAINRALLPSVSFEDMASLVG